MVYHLRIVVVPNAPCGVERRSKRSKNSHWETVPNAPCGVERLSIRYHLTYSHRFLMHRVELKAAVFVSTFIYK